MKRCFLLVSLMLLALPLSAWETALFRKKIPKNLNVKPLKQNPSQKTFFDKHFFSASFLKIYVDQALMVLKYPSDFQHSLDLESYELTSLSPLNFTQNNYEQNTLLQELAPFFDFDFNFGYTGINLTPSNLPHQLNYHALEDAVLTGFEAKETFVSYYNVHTNWSIFGHISLYEKYTSEKVESTLEKAILNLEEQMLTPYEKTYQQTVKYGMGLRWKKKLKIDSNITIDAEMLQRTGGLWTIQELLLQNYVYNGIQFDSWKFSVNFQF